MKQIAIITTNRVLAQSLMSAIKSQDQLKNYSIVMLDPQQALIDFATLSISIAILDMTTKLSDKLEEQLAFWREVGRVSPSTKRLILISGEDEPSRSLSITALKLGWIDDFFFYDTTLQYLFSKLATY